MPAAALLVAHGTRSPTGSATVRSLAAAVARARPDIPVALCFVDVETPTLTQELDRLAGRDVIVVPLLLSAGYHVRVDIPAAVEGRRSVRVAEHLGPHPLVIEAVADRLGTVADGATALLAAVPSSHREARDEVSIAAERLATRLGTDVGVVTLDRVETLADLPAPLAVASYLLAEGGFLDRLRDTVRGRGVVGNPIGAHPALVELAWTRYDAAIRVDPVG